MSIEEERKVADRVAKQMDRRAFAHEYQAIYRRLWLLAAGLVGDTSVADDIVQDAAIVAFGRLDEFREGSSFSAWLSEIVRRLALNFRRKAVRRKTYATDPEALDQQVLPPMTKELSPAGGLDEIVSEINDDMFRVLNEIPKDARCCMLLRVIDGLSYAEISEMTGIPEGTAMSHVHRAKSYARKRLQAASNDVGGPQ